MLLHIPAVLTAAQVADCRRALDQADWTDGRASAGHLSAAVKHNRQIPQGHPVAREQGDRILIELERSALFMSAALPLKVMPPLFNRYGIGENYGMHVDGAVQPVFGTAHRVRTDLSATLFLTDPADYDGGELVVDDTYGAHGIKLPAGDLILYPGSSLHQVRPVTRGARISSFFWIQSMVRDDSARTTLFELDSAIQETGRLENAGPSVLRLTNVYHNLLRRWTDV